MRKFAAILAVSAVMAAPVQAQPTGWNSWNSILSGTFTGGSSFATTMSVDLRWMMNAGVYFVGLDVGNVGSGAGEVFAAIGLINVMSGTASPGTAPSAWTWMRTGQLTGAGLPQNIWAWVAKPPPPKMGLQEGESAFFTFRFNGVPNLASLGVGVHAISGPNGCSTKFGVWNGGSSTNDAVSSGGSYDPSCVSVPEPATGALLATGLAGIVLWHRRRRPVIQEENPERHL